MSIALLCRHSSYREIVPIITEFRDRGLPISVVVGETASRNRYSTAEQQFGETHQAFRERMLGGKEDGPTVFLRIRSLAKRAWRRLPVLPKAVQTIGALAGDLSRRLMTTVATGRGGDPAFYEVEKHSSAATKELLAQYGVRYCVLWDSAWLIKEPLLSMCEMEIINVHCGRLPDHRGLDSLPWSVLMNDVVGNTSHIVDAGIDTGPMLIFREVVPEKGDTLLSLRQRVDDKRIRLFIDSIEGLMSGSLTPEPQGRDHDLRHRPLTLDEMVQAERHLQQRLSTGWHNTVQPAEENPYSLAETPVRV